jgi:hypothetical protein
MRRVFVDTEWTAVPWSSACDLLWIGLCDELGRNWCGLCSEARIDPANEAYVADLLQLMTPDVPRLKRAELATAVQSFCGDVDEIWAWIPTAESFATWSGIGDAAFEVYQRCRDIDLQMLRALVTPWPSTWPHELRDLNAAAAAAGVALPPRARNHLHPRVHVAWNRQLFGLIARAQPLQRTAPGNGRFEP